MEVEDIPQVLAIERDLFPVPWSEDAFLLEVTSPRISRSFVAEMEGKVVGYLVSWFVEDEVHLVNIAVARSHQRRGIGSALLGHLLSLALVEGQAFVTLEVRVSNRRAQRFYERFRFRSVALRKGYYTDNGEDALVMELDLEDYRRSRDSGQGG